METCFGDFGCFVFTSSLYDLRPNVVGFASWVGVIEPTLLGSLHHRAKKGGTPFFLKKRLDEG